MIINIFNIYDIRSIFCIMNLSVKCKHVINVIAMSRTIYWRSTKLRVEKYSFYQHFRYCMNCVQSISYYSYTPWHDIQYFTRKQHEWWYVQQSLKKQTALSKSVVPAFFYCRLSLNTVIRYIMKSRNIFLKKMWSTLFNRVPCLYYCVSVWICPITPIIRN